MKLFVMLVNYTAPIEKIEENLNAHRSYLSEGYKEGFLLASGPRNPKDGGLIIGKFECINCATAFSKADPFVQNHVAEYKIYEFDPVLHNTILDSFLK
ncbi:GTP cyclohydrolase [Helicobacter saguini]|uniref:GTP cyclohydrolase n=1 Tax=Helicobacter saguini TaxID=1548018 RepID=A0A347VSM9_9HELI|nr:YciI family protein [Helicobacter saguini]MWV62434.1 GTP cyclohydrolase [Helicobacter saguini]MWV66894.1 GTP cyclohydrolase [Helicobacter saguini]MWV69242.1 GTP cyclohydrolase [Helicobacter saguini]MWV71202.1 GTP cyclohydrolase [Helicobacter saguini]TLD93319.1 GTP cyclohydrolase [Helicobacter saguini]